MNCTVCGAAEEHFSGEECVEALKSKLDTITKQRDRETRGTTHSEECWRWHVECAEAKVIALQSRLSESESARADLREAVERYKPRLSAVTKRAEAAEADWQASEKERLDLLARVGYAEGAGEEGLRRWEAAEERAKALESRLEDCQSALREVLAWRTALSGRLVQRIEALVVERLENKS